jgi:raffinose/stachyose/melibiose transport system substrate-binding protein
MKRTRKVMLALVAVCAVAVMIFAATASGGAQAQKQTSAITATNLTIWWLGNQEVPGIETWMKQTIAKYHTLHPDVTVKSVVQSVDTWTQTQTTACKTGSGPDIWYNWAGTWSLQQVWAGCTVPNESVLPESELMHVPNIAEQRWQGKTWQYPLYTYEYPIVFNKALFKKAGLNPASPPRTWAQFIAACKKLNAAGITPIALGLKDGFGGEILGSASFQKQLYSNYNDLIKMTISGDFTSPQWKSWIKRVAELRPYVNKDVNSIAFGDGLGRFQSGNAAMVFGTPGFQATIIEMTKGGKQVGVMKPPVFGSGAYADSIVNTGNGFQVTSWSKNQKTAGDFMKFMHTPERLKALYAQTGNFPADNRWNKRQVTSPTDKLLLKWMAQKKVYYPANYYPTDLDVNGNFVVFQGLLGGNMTVDKAAQTYQNVITKWRKLHAGELKNYEKWLK